MAEKNEIKKIGVEEDEPILCPICDHCVFDENLEEPSISPCSHTIFIATEEAGLEYKTSLFENNIKDLGINIEPDAMFESDESWDTVTDKLTINGYIKVTYSNPSPSYEGIYYGFAPVDGNTEGV